MMKLNFFKSCKTQLFFAKLACPSCFKAGGNNRQIARDRSGACQIHLTGEAGKIMVE